MKKIIAGVILSMAVMMTLGTAAMAAPPDEAGIPPANASCIAACSHACVDLKQAFDGILAPLFIGDNLVPGKAHNEWLSPGPGVSATAQMTIQEECYDGLDMTLHR